MPAEAVSRTPTLRRLRREKTEYGIGTPEVTAARRSVAVCQIVLDRGRGISSSRRLFGDDHQRIRGSDDWAVSEFRL